MSLFFFWFVLSILAGVLASNKGRSGFGFFLLSIILSPLIGIIASLVAKSGDEIEREDAQSGDSEVYKKCPDCAETVKFDARKCRYCGFEFIQVENNADKIANKSGSQNQMEVPALMERYGITKQGDKYCYGDYRYDAVSDAVNYAKKMASNK